MHPLVGSLGHLKTARPPMVWVARALRGRFALRIRTPIRAERAVPAPFFIIGSGRSGNTLMRAMLHAHPQLAIPPESYVLTEVAWLGRIYRDDPWPAQVDRVLGLFDTEEFRATWDLPLGPVRERLLAAPPEERGVDAIVDAVYREYARYRAGGARRWGDKTPRNTLYLPWIADLFPEARYIHMLRDGRDVALSYARAGLYPTPEAAAARWVASVRHVRRFRKSVPAGRFLEVRYEDLVAAPEAGLERVCEFLQVPFHPEMLDYWQTGRQLGDTDRAHHANVGRPVTDRSVGRWRELSRPALGKLEEALGSTLRRHGYHS
jgi:protein-tyrosine sulfotransferase